MAAAQLQAEGFRQELASSDAHLREAREQLRASQMLGDQLEQQRQDLQDSNHQLLADLQVRPLAC